MRNVLRSSLFVAVFLLGVPAVAAAQDTATIDFEGLQEGQIVSTLSSGNGISGDAMPGSVAVSGTVPALSGNRAVIFDAECQPTATGGDDDLCQAGFGNVLIAAEDLVDANNDGRVDDPDDADAAGQTLVFDFSGFAGGQVDVASLDVLDVEQVEPGGVIEAYRNGALVKTVAIPTSTDGSVQTIQVDASDIDRLVVRFGGSAAVDNVEVEVDEDEEVGGEGCTPGFWKKDHPNTWAPTGFATGDLFDDVFGVAYNDDLTLLGALKLEGGGFKALARHATAALLNAAHPDVEYGLTSAQIIDLVQEAFEGDDPEDIKDLLEDFNEQGCGIDAHGNPID